MDVTVELEAPATPAAMFAAVGDLGRYPAWLEIVPRAVPVEPAPAAPAGVAALPAWSVDLRGRVGPLARSKRLRMVRTEHEPDRHARFERVETDGRHHSPWVLDALVRPEGDGSHLTMVLHYGGALFGPVLERILVEEIDRSKARLLALLSG